jgi:hypothetical protein
MRVDVDCRQDADETRGEEALRRVSPRRVGELSRRVPGADRADEQHEVVADEPGAVGVCEVAHEEIGGHDHQHDRDRRENAAEAQPGAVSDPELAEWPPANDQLDHDRDGDTDEQVHTLAIQGLPEIEDVSDRYPSGDERQPLEHSSRPRYGLRRRRLAGLACHRR